MRIITDFHLHSRWSRACSKDLTLPNIAKACERKGIQLVGTSDFTHPAWRQSIGQELEAAENDTYQLMDHTSPTRFLLSTELSCIYKRAGKVRRVHHLILFPALVGVDRLIASLEQRGCNLKSDGRPILGIDSEELLKLVLEADDRGLLIPAHVWTPWFAVFGSQSGFDSLEACFGEMTKYVYAIETGLSSNPEMNWRLSALDELFLVSNSDAHSLEKLGREANVFDMKTPSYHELFRILREHDTTRFVETIEFFPEEGKYHADGHRACGFWCEPEETKKNHYLCPQCGKPLVVGVLHRISDLADRPMHPPRPARAVPYRSIIPLAELIAEALKVGKSSKKITHLMNRLLTEGRTEFRILLDEPRENLSSIAPPELLEAIHCMHEERVHIRPGYDGEFGVIKILTNKNVVPKPKQAKFVLD